MWKFTAEQKQFEIGKVKIGGLPGENPTVLIGTIFYHGQKILRNEATGDFDRDKAEELIKVQEEFSDKTGNPCMLDVVGASPEAMRKSVEFAADVTDVPIVIDGPTMEVRIAGLEYAKEAGIVDRVVYNSLVPECRREELDKIRETDLKSAILLAYNIKEFTTAGRVKAIKGLLKVAHETGIDKPLIDTCVLDIPSFGMASRALFELKDELGLPAGCGAHNAISTWRGLKEKMGKSAIKPSIASVTAITAAIGADFVLYGPIDDAKYVFPPVAMIDVAYAQLLMEKGKKISRSHPIFKIA